MSCLCPCRSQCKGQVWKAQTGGHCVAAGAAERSGPVATVGTRPPGCLCSGNPEFCGCSEGRFPISQHRLLDVCLPQFFAHTRLFLGYSHPCSTRRPLYFSAARCPRVSALSPASRFSWSTCFKKLLRDLGGDSFTGQSAENGRQPRVSHPARREPVHCLGLSRAMSSLTASPLPASLAPPQSRF